MKLKQRAPLGITTVLIAIFGFLLQPLSALEPSRVLILPFTIHAEKDLSFLQAGIADMLSTRLTREGRILPLSREETRQAAEKISGAVTRQSAAALAAGLQADYVVYGSLTVLGDSISTDAHFLDVRQNEPVVTFSQVGSSQGDVIDHINQFAGQINDKLLGTPPQAAAVPPPAATPPATPASRAHPESLMVPEKGAPGETLIPGAPAAAEKVSGALWKSRRFNTRIIGMAIGDITGDGKNETVFIDANTIYVYRYADELFEKIDEISGKTTDTFLAVDVADINQNGRAEIFVTNIQRERRRLSSFVLEWNQTKFGWIEDNANWYFRVLKVPSKGQMLMGQKCGMNELFAGGVYQLEWNQGSYQEAQRQQLPEHVTVFGFTYGDALNNGGQQILALAESGELRIFNPDGSQEYTTTDPYGGSEAYLEFPSEAAARIGEYQEMDRFYLPQRIHVADVDGNGVNEVIVVKNEEMAGRRLARMRQYKSGHIESLVWNQLGLDLKWKTQEITGYLSDYTLGDLNNDGRDELVFCLATKTGAILGKDRSYIVAQQLH